MTKRAKLITALIAAIGLVVVAPLAAVAYWAVTAQFAVTAKSSTFSMAPFDLAPAPSGASTTFSGSATTQYFTAPLVNDGATPWGSQTLAVAVAAASGLGPAAVATVQVAFTTASGACHADTAYAGIASKSAVSASSWSSSTAVPAGGTVYACIKLVVTDTDTRTPSGTGAPAQTVTLATTATAAQQRWTDQHDAQVTLTSTGWASCQTTGNAVVLTPGVPVPPGSYTATRADTGEVFSVTASPNGKTISVTNPATSDAPTVDTYITIRNAQGTVIAAAKVTFRSPLVNKSVACA